MIKIEAVENGWIVHGHHNSVYVFNDPAEYLKKVIYLTMPSTTSKKFIHALLDENAKHEIEGCKSIWNELQELSPWCESSDMPWSDEILVGLAGVRDRIERLEQDNILLRQENALLKKDWYNPKSKEQTEPNTKWGLIDASGGTV